MIAKASVGRGLRRATQPTHDSNRRALVVLAVLLVVLMGWLVASRTVLHHSPAPTAPIVPKSPSALVAPHVAPPVAPPRTSARNPFQVP
ncbi:MAG: hypothetical protein ACRDY0_05580 [Acidimicrobiales bacterium]